MLTQRLIHSPPVKLKVAANHIHISHLHSCHILQTRTEYHFTTSSSYAENTFCLKLHKDMLIMPFILLAMSWNNSVSKVMSCGQNDQGMIPDRSSN